GGRGRRGHRSGKPVRRDRGDRSLAAVERRLQLQRASATDSRHKPLVAFVTRTREGYCQHFAGAMALMLRYLGIPTRVAAGFTSGTYDGDHQTWTVTDH